VCAYITRPSACYGTSEGSPSRWPCWRLLILSTLVISFALLATSEPLISRTNQKMVAQARAVAGLALAHHWAAQQPAADPNGLPTSLATVPAPYDGSAPIPISVNGTQIGVVFVTVKGRSRTLRSTRTSAVWSAVGWSRRTRAAGPSRTRRSRQRSPSSCSGGLPAASLTVAGEINVGGNANIDSRADTSCGAKEARGARARRPTEVRGRSTEPTATTRTTRTVSGLTSSSPPIDISAKRAPPSRLIRYTLKNADLNSLKALAQAKRDLLFGLQRDEPDLQLGPPAAERHHLHRHP